MTTTNVETLKRDFQDAFGITIQMALVADKNGAITRMMEHVCQEGMERFASLPLDENFQLHAAAIKARVELAKDILDALEEASGIKLD